MTTEKYDVVVVGGGPAGSMAARAAALKGAKTLLLERDPVIGTPVRCGEGVAVQNLSRFIEIDEKWVASRIEGVTIYAPDGTPVSGEITGQIGVILERTLFDRRLSELAAESGAQIITRAEGEGLIMDEEGVKGVIYRRFNRVYKVTCEMVIAADGVESRVGRWAGINTHIAAGDYQSAYQMVLAGIDFDPRHCHFYVGNTIAPGGYIWVFPKGEKTANVGIGVEVKKSGSGVAYRLLTDFIRKRFGRPSIVGESAGGVPVARPLKKPFRNGILLAGDAARHCNPLTGGGIYTGMISGWQAGEVAAEAVAAGNRSERFLKRFLDRIENEITIPHRRAYHIARAVAQLTDESMNRTARELLSIPPEQRTVRKVFLTGLKENPKLIFDVMRYFI
ncbi:MAG: NAD(P)/FAD-dependent oxidoreductase [Calditrichota bacterium]